MENYSAVAPILKIELKNVANFGQLICYSCQTRKNYRTVCEISTSALRIGDVPNLLFDFGVIAPESSKKLLKICISSHIYTVKSSVLIKIESCTFRHLTALEVGFYVIRYMIYLGNLGPKGH